MFNGNICHSHGLRGDKTQAGHARKTPLFWTRIQNKSVRFISWASSSDENSVKSNSALARLSVSNAHMETITRAQIKYESELWGKCVNALARIAFFSLTTPSPSERD